MGSADGGEALSWIIWGKGNVTVRALQSRERSQLGSERDVTVEECPERYSAAGLDDGRRRP